MHLPKKPMKTKNNSSDGSKISSAEEKSISEKVSDASSDVIIKKKGGGTLIDSPAQFSDDGKYLYVNGGSCLQIFSIKTGECVREIDTRFRIAGVFSIDNNPCAVTSDFTLFNWHHKSGRVLKKYETVNTSRVQALSAMLCPSSVNRTDKELCVVVYNSDINSTYIQFFSKEMLLLSHPLSNTSVSQGLHNISFGGMQKRGIFCCINSGYLLVYTLDGQEVSQRIKAGVTKYWTCCICHPSEEHVAVGDSIGRIVVLRDPFNNTTVQNIYHWHTLPVNVIALSPAGSNMYSGGSEHTLVKWNYGNPNVKNFLPRLPGSIVHITLSPDCTLLALSTLDNGIILVDSTNSIKCVMQQLAWGVIDNKLTDEPLFPAGIQFDPRSRAVILNSRPGHLQFYQPETKTFLFSVDVTQLNYLTQERDRYIVNTDVSKCCVSNDAAWLATVEIRNEPGLSLEQKLKFWHYNVSKKKFQLNTVIDLPHKGEVNCLRFCPGTDSLASSEIPETDYLVVTTGKDNKFRLWKPRDLESIYRTGVSWRCENVGSYKNKACSCASFSQDGSLLAVGFEQTLTIWSMDPLTLCTTLAKSNLLLTHVEFAKSTCSHFIVTCTMQELTVWNLLTLTVKWTVEVKPSILVTDPASPFIALFSKNNNVYVFTPLSCNPIYTKNGVCGTDTAVCGASFIKRDNPLLQAPVWLQKSLLYFITGQQDLKCFESDCEVKEETIRLVEDEEKGTVFSTLIAKQKRDETVVTMGGPKTLQFGTLGSSGIHKVLMAPAHTMPPISLLCSSLLESLAISENTKTNEESEKKKSRRNHSPSLMEVDTSSEDESKPDREPPKRATVITEDLGLGYLYNPSDNSKDVFVIDINMDDANDDIDDYITNFNLKE